jgi:hypothetical protein
MAPTTTERPGQYALLTRDLWATVMRALDSPTPFMRRRVYAELLRIAPPGWDTDLEQQERRDE